MNVALLSLPPRRRGVLFRYSPGTGGASFTRSTTGTYKDATGTRQTAGINVLRDGHYVGGVRTTLLEGSSQNVFLQSGAPATQTITLTTGSWTLWLEGTGSIAIAAGTAVLTGAGTASAGVPVTINVTTGGTVTCTVTGSPTLAQLEPLAFPSSYIPTTTAAVTRGADLLNLPIWFNPQALTLYGKYVNLGTAQMGVQAGLFSIGNSADTGNRLDLFSSSGGVASVFAMSGATPTQVGSAVIPALTDVTEIRCPVDATFTPGVFVARNGGAESGATATSPGMPASFAAQLLWINSTGGASVGFMALQSLKVAAGVRSLADMRSL